jgi:hypothetical protein
MMTIPLVTQLRFTRSEFSRCLDGVSEEDAIRKVDPMNCLSWFIGHLAVQENFYWVYMGQGKTIHADLNDRVGYGKSPTTPPLKEMMETWRDITREADTYLDVISLDLMETHIEFDDKQSRETIGTMLLRNMYHYWFHTGEAHAVRQMLRHKDLPDFVGNMSDANYSHEKKGK